MKPNTYNLKTESQNRVKPHPCTHTLKHIHIIQHLAAINKLTDEMPSFPNKSGLTSPNTNCNANLSY